MIPLFDDDEGAQKFVELEWETNVFGANFRPGNGDRVSAFGYLIYDCGHPPFRVEIHPPVGLAAHRNRAIIDEKLVSVGPEVLLDVQVLCASLPNRLCKIYFGDLPVPQGPESPGYGRFTGSGHHFKMDLMTTSIPGAMVWWMLTDGGEPSGDDTVHIKVFDADNTVIHEATGSISGGNIHSHEY